ALNGAGHGLAIVDTRAGAPGTFISYSTSPGAEAEDGNGADSPYTAAVLTVARQPNVPIEDVFKRIRVSVAQATDGRQ
ncbi:caspase family protein, partial [Staphylococcus aureus]